MINDLKDIGFYTLSDERAKQVSHKSPLWRCEMLVTKRCNFNCPYCRGVGPEQDMTFTEAFKTLQIWFENGLKNVRFSGGEPTLWKYLPSVVSLCRVNNVERIAISTNGSADPELYKYLVKLGANDFSISLDACCAEDCKRMSGGRDIWTTLVDNIKMLSELTYTTVGVVLTDDNAKEVVDIVEFAKSLGVADVRVIPAAQVSKSLDILPDSNLPILEYRRNNIDRGETVRGLRSCDPSKCPLVLDDMAVIGDKHYPCIIYARELGEPIGVVDDNVREQRKEWFDSHNVKLDPICANNCLDVCRDHNKKVMHYATFK